MYPFSKAQQDDRTWCFELNGINVVMDEFFIKDDKHWFKDPYKAIAYFSIEGNLYGLSNFTDTKPTAEDLYDVMLGQYAYFTTDPLSEPFFHQHGFVLKNNSWNLEVVDGGIRNQLRFDKENGAWYYNDILLKKQPANIGDVLQFYRERARHKKRNFLAL